MIYANRFEIILKMLCNFVNNEKLESIVSQQSAYRIGQNCG